MSVGQTAAFNKRRHAWPLKAFVMGGCNCLNGMHDDLHSYCMHFHRHVCRAITCYAQSCTDQCTTWSLMLLMDCIVWAAVQALLLTLIGITRCRIKILGHAGHELQVPKYLADKFMVSPHEATGAWLAADINRH